MVAGSSFQLWDRVKNWQLEYVRRRPGDPPALYAGKIRARLGWSPRYTDIREIVETAWRWHEAHPAGYNTSARLDQTV